MTKPPHDKKHSSPGAETTDESAHEQSSEAQDIEIESVGLPDEVAAMPDKKLKAALDEVAKWKNDYLYLRADFDNYRKSVIKERADLIKYGCERLIIELLGFLDTVDRVLQMQMTPENVEQFRSGFEMTATELKNVLQQFGVKELEAAGQAFNPAEHEAVSSEETDLVPPGHIFRVFKKAYKLHDRLIRPAQVVVAKELTPKES